MSMSVCGWIYLFVCPQAYLRFLRYACAHQNFIKFSVRVAYYRQSVFLWQCCAMMCTSSFANDFMFAHNSPGRGN